MRLLKYSGTKEKYGKIVHILYKKEANLATVCRAYTLVSALFSEFLSKTWAILTIFMSSTNTFTTSMAPPALFDISSVINVSKEINYYE